MGYALGKDIYFCISGEQVALLNLKSNCYMALPRDADIAFRQVISGTETTIENAAGLEALLSSGVLTICPDKNASIQSVNAVVPVGSFTEGTRPPFRLGGTVLSALSLLKWDLTLKFYPLSKIVGGIRKRKSKNFVAGGCDNLKTLLEASRVFKDAAMLVPVQDKCLSRSLALIKYLSGRGQFPNLVIGIKMRPFAAHAWVQHGGVVLNDTVDNVIGFTPILVV